MRKAIAVAAAIAVGTLMGGAGQAGGPTSAIASYVGVVGDLTVMCNATPEVNIGGGCFTVGGSSAVINVADSVNTTAVGFQLGWYDVDFRRIGDFVTGLCNGAEVGVPAGATSLKVFVDGPINGPADCNVPLPGGVGVSGTITVDWF